MFQQDLLNTLTEFDVGSKEDFYRLPTNKRPHRDPRGSAASRN
jgi:hypothetical protein